VESNAQPSLPNASFDVLPNLTLGSRDHEGRRGAVKDTAEDDALQRWHNYIDSQCSTSCRPRLKWC